MFQAINTDELFFEKYQNHCFVIYFTLRLIKRAADMLV